MPVETNLTATLNGFLEFMRSHGYLIGYEIASTRAPTESEPEAYRAYTIESGAYSARSFLERVLSMYGLYAWRVDESAGYINIYPKTNSLSKQVVSACVIKERTLRQVFADDFAALSKYNISLQPQRRGRPFFDNLVVTIDFPGGTVADFLNGLASSVGRGVSWTLHRTYQYGTVEFKFDQSVPSLESFRSSQEVVTNLPQRLQDIQERLAKSVAVQERVSLLRESALIQAEAGDTNAASLSFDRAIETAQLDEEKWVLRETRIRALYPATSSESAEYALAEYSQFIDICPYDDIRLNAILEMSYAFRILGRAGAGTSLLKDAYDRYPEKRELIRRKMMIHFPAFVSDLGPDLASEAGRVPEAFYRKPTTGETQNIIRNLNSPTGVDQ